MRQYESFIQQRFGIPNTRLAIVISQRRDGPYRNDPPFSEQGCYFVAAEEVEEGGVVRYLSESALGAQLGYSSALQIAEALWGRLVPEKEHA